ncbi:S8 family serine peptidase, partial [Carnobacterium sp.]|uniref:S8 family serine peptidase n=1 Tax=Carnobacterium sp. TaxID=48221 RepID=UPI003C78CA62
MNNVLELRGNRFVQASRGGSFGGPSMNGKEIVTSEKINRLIKKISQIKKFWQEENKPFEGVLISVHYNKIVAKSNRIGGLFKGHKSNGCVVGAKFNSDRSKHIITYYLNSDDLVKSIELLEKANNILAKKFNSSINNEILKDKTQINSSIFKNYPITQSPFKQVIADVSYIDDFEIEYSENQGEQSIVTLYDTKSDTKKILNSLGIDILTSRILDDQTVFLDGNQLDLLFAKAPYLISMATVDLSKLAPSNFIQNYDAKLMSIPTPDIESTIGVIDTLFDKSVYFNEWVEYHDLIDDNIPKEPRDYSHGTAVTSIIVDGPTLNPWLDDGCGRFKVRHFGVATGSSFSSFSITKQIKEIVTKHKDIKVWNISLGSNDEINSNFISAESAILDQIQFENDIIFVVAGTNKPN